MRAIVLISLLSLSCYQTSTSDNRTVRVNTITGKSEKLVGGQWVPIAEPRATAKPESLPAECRNTRLSPETLRRIGVICPATSTN